MFAWNLGNSGQKMGSFNCMYTAAKANGATRVYGHNVSEVDGKAMPQPRRSVDIILVLDDPDFGQWSAASLGDFFTNFHVTDLAKALVRPHWRVHVQGFRVGLPRQSRLDLTKCFFPPRVDKVFFSFG